MLEIEQEARLIGLRQQIERGEYAVDPKAVADAIIRRLLAGEQPDQKRCS